MQIVAAGVPYLRQRVVFDHDAGFRTALFAFERRKRIRDVFVRRSDVEAVCFEHLDQFRAGALLRAGDFGVRGEIVAHRRHRRGVFFNAFLEFFYEISHTLASSGVIDHYRDKHEDHLHEIKDEEERNEILPPFFDGHLREAAHDGQVCRRPQNVRKAVAVLEGEDRHLARDVQYVGERRHDGHRRRRLPGAGRDEEVDQRLDEKHAFRGNPFREQRERRREGVNDGVDYLPLLHHDENAARDTDDAGAEDDVFPRLYEYLGYLRWAPTVNEAAGAARDQQQSAQFVKVPAARQDAPDEEGHADEERDEHHLVARREFRCDEFVVVKRERTYVDAVHKALFGVLLDHRAVTHQPDGAHSYKDKP
ncbi:hypothetical protein SDC9_139120 [bioreactor metagenome]|uniref:Uncharacterized protein n=1 Tax=bioreactor metagenome TaxID=1076179 RepID=A0A645DRN7_9ZZZZ